MRKDWNCVTKPAVSLQTYSGVWGDNPPLTLEQLREMDGEPVWVVFLDGSRSERWAIVHVYGKGPEDLECYTPQYERLPGWAYGALGDHGWRAYRRKPEEGTT